MSTEGTGRKKSVKGRAYGLDIEADFGLLGISRPPDYDGSRRVTLELTSKAHLDQAIGTQPTERLVEVPGSDGRVMITVDAGRGEPGGLTLSADGFGTAWIHDDGGRVLCVPVGGPAWRWQRFLAGQVLPFAAVLHGLEVFHASALVNGDSAIAIVAGSGVGKTSVALNLALHGMSFLNDDVLVVEPTTAGGVLAHPGPGLANVSTQERGLVEQIQRAGIGARLGETEHELRTEVRRHGCPAHLNAMFFLERVGAGEHASVERISPIEPSALLGATFNLVVRTPDRLARQLDVCARLAESCAFFKVSSPPAMNASALAAEIHQTASAREPQLS